MLLISLESSQSGICYIEVAFDEKIWSSNQLQLTTTGFETNLESSGAGIEHLRKVAGQLYHIISEFLFLNCFFKFIPS